MYILYSIVDFIQNSFSKIDKMINVSPIKKLYFVNLMPLPPVYSESAYTYSYKNQRKLNNFAIVLFDS